jgi:hypothetical protein
MLADRYSETLRSQALTSGNQIVEVYVGTTGSWTFLTVSPAGQACMIASGEMWTAETPQPLGDDL